MNNIQFDDKAATWDTPEKAQRANVFADVIRRHKLADYTTALEYGAGTGLVSFALQDQFNEIVLADISLGMLNEATRKINLTGSTNIVTQQLNLLTDTVSKNYDMVYSLMALHHIPDTKAIFAKFAQILTTHGKLLIADLDAEDGSFHGINVDVHHGFVRDELRNIALQAGFRHVEIHDLMVMHRDDLGRDYPLFVLVAEK